MPQFYPRSSTFEAHQFNGFYATPWPPGVQVNNDTDPSHGRNALFVIGLHENRVYLQPGQWVVPYVNYPNRYRVYSDEEFRCLFGPVVAAEAS